MDMARGSLLFQMWTDENWLTPPERTQVATFIDLLRANPYCFRHPRPILGNPDKAEAYGYSCCDGKHAFLSIDNACLQDRKITLKLGSNLGLPEGRNWNVFRWYPDPARLTAQRAPIGGELRIALRPYEVVLLEVVADESRPSLNRKFPDAEARFGFEESTSQLKAGHPVVSYFHARNQSWVALRPIVAKSLGGAELRVQSDASILAKGANPPNDVYSLSFTTKLHRVTGLMLEALSDSSLPAHGPGRCYDGNFAVTNLRLQVVPLGHPELAHDLKFGSTIADFYQTSYGGMPPRGMIDDDPKSRWSIHPRVGESHAALLVLEAPATVPPGAELRVTISHGDNDHNLVRFRISACSHDSPALPIAYQPVTATTTYNVPPTTTGGILFLVGGSPDSPPQAKLGGKSIPFVSVWSAQANWSCPWTAWRAALSPSQRIQKLEISIEAATARSPEKLAVYVLPR